MFCILHFFQFWYASIDRRDGGSFRQKTISAEDHFGRRPFRQKTISAENHFGRKPTLTRQKKTNSAEDQLGRKLGRQLAPQFPLDPFSSKRQPNFKRDFCNCSSLLKLLLLKTIGWVLPSRLAPKVTAGSQENLDAVTDRSVSAEMVFCRNGLLPKWSSAEMAFCRNGLLPKWSSAETDFLPKWSFADRRNSH